jgi:hypothetical protein
MVLLKQEADPNTEQVRSRHFLGVSEKEVLLRETYINGVIDHSNVDPFNLSNFYEFYKENMK